MRTAFTALLLLLTGPAFAPAWSQAPRARDAFDLSLAVSVLSAALAFIAPRALDPVSVQQLALWGLSAPGSLDGALATELRDGAIVLLQDGKLVFTRPMPPGDNPDAWGALVAEVLQAAARASPMFRAAGLRGALTSVFDEMFNHLDPYSRYVAPGAADLDIARRSGEAGAGIQVNRDRQGFVVTGINADGPGAEAGIRVGDHIIAVDGQSTAGEDLDTVLEWISGLEGSDLSITVRTRGGPARTLDLERAIIPPETVFPKRMNDILMVRISRFSDDTGQRLAHELERNLAGPRGKPIRGVILDLRGNRGGRLREAIAAIDILLNRGLIAQTAGRDPEAAHTYLASAGDIAEGRPLVILVDGRSASAAEIMAAALADQGRGIVVGSSTLGKGLVQTIKRLPDGGELFVSWSRVIAPLGWPIQGLGVLPQVCTSMGPDAMIAQLQALDAGTQPMAAAIARHRGARAPLPAAEALALRNTCPASEGRDADLSAARFLITHRTAYRAALLSPPP